MNILFLSLSDYKSINESNIYTDLLREFKAQKHNVYLISTSEKKNNLKTALIDEGNSKLLRVRIGNIFNVNLVQKGITTITVQNVILRALNKYLSDVKFDLVMYSTPPITFVKVVEFIKKRDNAITYLLLKDIFPQNALDLNLLTKKNPIYYYFRYIERTLYKVSDYIGCMSEANIEYIRKHNPELRGKTIEVCPNSISIISRESISKPQLKKEYNLPLDKLIFIYGGNLGKPQGVEFIIEVLKKNQNLGDRYIVICGKGTEYYKLENYIKINEPTNIRLIRGLEKKDYDQLIQACDVGLVFLDYRFTIPNFPSRILSYMEYSLPIVACTDRNTDVGKIIENEGLGYSCESNDANEAKNLFDRIVEEKVKLPKMGERAYQFLCLHYTSKNCYQIIMKHFL